VKLPPQVASGQPHWRGSLPLGALLIFVVGFLAVGTLPVDAARRNWQGDTNIFWGTASNWSNNDVPDSNDIARFNTAFTGPNQPFVAVTDTLQGIIFSANLSRDVAITGASNAELRLVSFGNNDIGINNRSSRLISIDANLDLNNNQRWQGNSMSIGGNVSLDNFDLELRPNTGATFDLSGEISGSGDIIKTQGGTVVLSGTNSYSGSTSISGGTLVVDSMSDGGSSSSIGSSSSSAANLSIEGGTLRYIGTGDSSDRSFTLGTGGATIDSSGSGALNLTNTGSLDYSGSGTRTLTLSGSNADTNILSADLADGSGGATSLVKEGTGTWRIDGDNTLSGDVTVRDGILGLNSATVNGAIPSDLVVGDGTGSANSAVVRNCREGQIGNSSTVTVLSDGWFDINAGAYPNEYGPSPLKDETVGQVNLVGGRITTGSGGSLNIDPGDSGDSIASFASSQTALIDATGGQVNLNGDRIISVEDGGAATDLEIRGAIVSEQNGGGSVTKTGAGYLSFTGSESNTYTGPTVVDNGTLEVAKTGGATAIAGTAVTVNAGGTLMLGGADQINDSANLTLNGGTFSSGNGFSESLGTLTMTGNSTIDLGSAIHMLEFTNSSATAWSGALTIYGWQGLAGTSGTNGQIFVGSNLSGLTNAQLALISFDGFGPGAMLLTDGELVPVPVPEAPVVISALLLLLAVGFREKTRIRSWFHAVWMVMDKRRTSE